MPQVNYTPIQLYRSGTAGNTPSADLLQNGELAINYADGKLFYKDGAGTVRAVVTPDGSVTTAKIVDANVTPAKLSTGAPSWTSNGALTTTGKLTVSGTGTLGVAIQSTDASASAYRLQFLDYRNENGVPVVNNGVDVNTNGSSEWFASTSPAGARNSDRRVEGLRVDGAQNLKFNSGYGSTAVAFGCRAWVNFNGTGSAGANQTIRGAGNVSSVYKNGTGDFTVNFVTAMPDANYAITTCVEKANGAYIPSAAINPASAPAAGSFRILTGSENLTNDRTYINVAVFR